MRDNADMDMPVSQTSALAELPGARWNNGFAALDPVFYTRLQPTPLPEPYWVGTSQAVAQTLGLPADWLRTDDALQVLSGNRGFAGAQPLASVYSGHQFGQWAGQLGDCLLYTSDAADE